MAEIIADRVAETSATTGTGTYSLAGAMAGFQSFVAGVGDGNTCRYMVTDDTNWEVGLGTIADASPDTLARTTIEASSNSGSAVDWSAGSKNIYHVLSAGKINTLAASGANSDITSMTGLDDDGIPLAKVANAASDGVNTDISSLNGPALGTPASGDLQNCTEAAEDAKGVVERATNDEVAAFTDETRYVSPEGLGYAMSSVLAYGVDWDEDDSSPTLTRTGALAGIAAASSPGNACLPVQAAMRRCILNDAGTVEYYLCATDSTKKEDGTTASSLDGTDGQVMVEIPKFYYKYSYVASTNVHSWSISAVPLAGYEPHTAFYKDGAWVDYRYIGAYEGIGWDQGTTAYVDCGTGAADNWAGGAIDLVNDKLGSVSGKAPMMDETRAEFRAIALNRGSGWRQQDFYLVSAIQLLYITEYASWNSQAMIGMGRTELSGGTWIKNSYIGVSGKSNGSGNATANTGGNTNDAYMSYRGIENFYGNIWKWVDGFNINDGIPYVSNVETDFADDTDTNYYRLEDTGGSGITLPQGANDYQSTLEQIVDGFLPSALEGSSDTYITDYYYQAADWRVAGLGGHANIGLAAGVACWFLSAASAYDDVAIGGRLCF